MKKLFLLAITLIIFIGCKKETDAPVSLPNFDWSLLAQRWHNIMSIDSTWEGGQYTPVKFVETETVYHDCVWDFKIDSVLVDSVYCYCQTDTFAGYWYKNSPTYQNPADNRFSIHWTFAIQYGRLILLQQDTMIFIINEQEASIFPWTEKTYFFSKP